MFIHLHLFARLLMVAWRQAEPRGALRGPEPVCWLRESGAFSLFGSKHHESFPLKRASRKETCAASETSPIQNQVLIHKPLLFNIRSVTKNMLILQKDTNACI